MDDGGGRNVRAEDPVALPTSGGGTFRCVRCHRGAKPVSGGLNEFLDHLVEKHPAAGLVCPHCDQRFAARKRVLAHVAATHHEGAGDGHGGDKRSTTRQSSLTSSTSCSKCGKDFMDQYKLRRHIKEVHDQSKDHGCSTCGKSFTRPDKLKKHQLIHLDGGFPASAAGRDVVKPLEWVAIRQNLHHNQQQQQHSLEDILQMRIEEAEAAVGSDRDTSSDDGESEDSEVTFTSDTKAAASTASVALQASSSILDDDDDGGRDLFGGIGEAVAASATSEVVTVFRADEGAPPASRPGRGPDAGSGGDKGSAASNRAKASSRAKVSRAVMASERRAHMKQLNEKRSQRMKEWGAVYRERLKEMEGKAWGCQLCPESGTVVGTGGIVKHNREAHPDASQFRCPVCGVSSLSQAKLKNHLYSVHFEQGPQKALPSSSTSTSSSRHLEEEAAVARNLGRHFLLDDDDGEDDVVDDDVDEDDDTAIDESLNRAKSGVDDGDSSQGDDDDEGEGLRRSSRRRKTAFWLKKPRLAGQKRAKAGTEEPAVLLSAERLVRLPERWRPNGSWSSDEKFTCFRCQERVSGLEEATAHVSAKHDPAPKALGSGEGPAAANTALVASSTLQVPWFGCIRCPASFVKKVLLKAHIYKTHVLPAHKGDLEVPIEGQDDGVGEDWGSELTFNCYICTSPIRGFERILQHMSEAHPLPSGILRKARTNPEVATFQCIICPKRFKRRYHLKVHMLRHMNSLDPTLRTHCHPVKLWMEEQDWICKRCHPAALNPIEEGRREGAAATLPKVVEGQGLPPPADEVGVVAMGHVVEDDGQPRKYRGLNAFIHHVQLNHLGNDRNTFLCPVCLKKFSKRDNFRSHVSIHRNERLSCDVCGKEFADNNKRRRHIAEVHVGRKNHKCETCDKSFARPEKLRAHLASHCRNPVAARERVACLCLNCGKGFSSQEQGNRHEKRCGNKAVLGPDGQPMPPKKKRKVSKKPAVDEAVSTTASVIYYPEEGDPGSARKEAKDTELTDLAGAIGLDKVTKDPSSGLFKCMDCDGLFKSRRYIVEHYARHHNDHHRRLPHRCDLCGKGFKIAKDLTRHLKRPHSEDYLLKYVFVCPIEGCGKRFRKELGLKRHALLHQGVRNFRCDKCPKTFHIRQTLRTHYRLRHGLELPSTTTTTRTATTSALAGDEPKGFDLSLADPTTAGRSVEVSRNGLLASGPMVLKEAPPVKIVVLDDDTDQGAAAEKVGAAKGRHNRIELVVHDNNVGSVGAAVQTGLINLMAAAECTEGGGGGGQGGRAGDAGADGGTSIVVVTQDALGHWVPAEGGYFMTDATGQQFSVVNYHQSPAGDGGTVLQFEDGILAREFIAQQGSGGLASGDGVRSVTLQGVNDFPEFASAAATAASVQSLTDSQGRQILLKVEGQDHGEVEDDDGDDDGKGVVLVEPAAPPASGFVKAGSSRRKKAETKILGEHEQQQIVSELMGGGLGEVCTACFKIFRTKEALDFHVLNSKMPGHSNLVQQRLHINMAEENAAQVGDHKLLLEATKEAPEMDGGVDDRPFGGAADSEDPANQPPDRLVYILDPKADNSLQPPPAVEPSSTEGSDVVKANNGKNVFQCSECPKSFKNDMKLIRHVVKRHRSGKPPDGGEGDEEAIATAAGPTLLDIVAKSLKAATEKLKTSQDAAAGSSAPASLKFSPMGCPDCEVSFFKCSDLMEHFESPPHRLEGVVAAADDEASSHTCPVLTCESSYPTRDKLVDHLVAGKHGQRCPQCGLNFSKLSKLEHHILEHSHPRDAAGRKLFPCSKCSKSYKDASSLATHMMVHSGSRPHVCKECGMGFMKPDHLKRHVNTTHLKIRHIKCSYCEKMFSDKHKAKIHERRHTGEKPYACDTCSKTFKRKEALDNHAILHSDAAKDFKCAICGAGFISQPYLNRHIDRHYAEKKHKCQFCDMSFIDGRDLRVHIKHVHENYRPFVCQTCSTAYKTKKGLATHLKQHQNGSCLTSVAKKGPSSSGTLEGVLLAAGAGDLGSPEPRRATAGNRTPAILRNSDPLMSVIYECPECHKTFKSKARVEMHLRKHMEEQQQQQQILTMTSVAGQEAPHHFLCSVETCNRTFMDEHDLGSHLKEAHGLEIVSIGEAVVAGGAEDAIATVVAEDPADLQGTTPNQHIQIISLPQDAADLLGHGGTVIDRSAAAETILNDLGGHGGNVMVLESVQSANLVPTTNAQVMMQPQAMTIARTTNPSSTNKPTIIRQNRYVDHHPQGGRGVVQQLQHQRRHQQGPSTVIHHRPTSSDGQPQMASYVIQLEQEPQQHQSGGVRLLTTSGSLVAAGGSRQMQRVVQLSVSDPEVQQLIQRQQQQQQQISVELVTDEDDQPQPQPGGSIELFPQYAATSYQTVYKS